MWKLKKEVENSNKGVFNQEEVLDIFFTTYKRKYGVEPDLPTVYFLHKHKPEKWMSKNGIINYFRTRIFVENEFTLELYKEIESRLYARKVNKLLNS